MQSAKCQSLDSRIRYKAFDLWTVHVLNTELVQISMCDPKIVSSNFFLLFLLNKAINHCN